jgi:hypothetical protein
VVFELLHAIETEGLPGTPYVFLAESTEDCLAFMRTRLQVRRTGQVTSWKHRGDVPATAIRHTRRVPLERTTAAGSARADNRGLVSAPLSSPVPGNGPHDPSDRSPTPCQQVGRRDVVQQRAGRRLGPHRQRRGPALRHVLLLERRVAAEDRRRRVGVGGPEDHPRIGGFFGVGGVQLDASQQNSDYYKLTFKPDPQAPYLLVCGDNAPPMEAKRPGRSSTDAR